MDSELYAVSPNRDPVRAAFEALMHLLRSDASSIPNEIERQSRLSILDDVLLDSYEQNAPEELQQFTDRVIAELKPSIDEAIASNRWPLIELLIDALQDQPSVTSWSAEPLPEWTATTPHHTANDKE